MNRNKIIEEAQELLRKGWTKGYLARNSAGQPANVLDKEACSFCALGAIYRVYGRDFFADNPMGGVHLIYVNDYATSVDEVIAYLENLKEPV